MQSWNSVVDQSNPRIVMEMLGEIFKDTEKDFFQSIQHHIDEKESLQRIIPQVSFRQGVVMVVAVVCVLGGGATLEQ